MYRIDAEGVYVVHMLHSDSHGEESSIMLVTNSITHAVHTTHRAENLGFAFSGETYVAISFCEIDKIYSKVSSRSPGVMVFARRHYRGEWTEQWFDKELEAEFTQAESAPRRSVLIGRFLE